MTVSLTTVPTSFLSRGGRGRSRQPTGV